MFQMGLFSGKRMQKYRSKVEYDGRHYVGWQRQDNGPSIQAAVEENMKRNKKLEIKNEQNPGNPANP